MIADDLMVLAPGAPITWIDHPSGPYSAGGVVALDATIKKVCAKRVRIEVVLPDGSTIERVVTRECLRMPGPSHPRLLAALKAARVRHRILELAKELSAWSFTPGDEANLQRGILRMFSIIQRFGVATSEVIGERGRYDVLLKDDTAAIVLELKVKGSAAAVERQAQRYALTSSVDGVVVVTTSNRLAAQLKPGELGGKPFGVVAVRTGV